MMPTLTRKDRRQALTLTFLAFVVVGVLWTNVLNLPQAWVDALMTPLRLFVTYVHEAGHAIGALVTGGQVIGFNVSPNGAGLAITTGGSRAVILPAGYVGATLFGAVLFYVANRFPRAMKTLSTMLGVAMIGFTVLFARLDASGSPLAFVLGVGFGGLLVLIGLKAPLWFTLLTLNVLAVMTSLNAVLDLWGDIRVLNTPIGYRHDASAFSREVMPILPPVLVAIIWAGIAVVSLGISAYYALWKPLNQELSDALK